MSSPFCVLPWVHLATHPHGGVTLCCISDHTSCMNRARNVNEDGSETLLDLNRNSIEEIMNSDYYQTVRMQMLSGVYPAACRRCYNQEDSGIHSKRMEENANYKLTEDEARAITSPIGKIDVDLRFVELRLGNVCNLKCRSCNPASSTKWKTEYRELQNKMPFVTKYDYEMDTSWTESDKFWEDLLVHSKNVEVIYINGGEPTLVEKHWGYLQRLIDAGLNEKVVLWYNINMTNLPTKLLGIWRKFKEVRISASIDDLYSRNDFIRTGSKWADVERNLNVLLENPWLKTSICQTVSSMNVWFLDEFYEYMTMERGLHVHHNFLHDPSFMSAANLPDHQKIELMSKLESSNRMEAWRLAAIRHYLSPKADLVKYQQYKDYMVWSRQHR